MLFAATSRLCCVNEVILGERTRKFEYTDMVGYIARQAWDPSEFALRD